MAICSLPDLKQKCPLVADLHPAHADERLMLFPRRLISLTSKTNLLVFLLQFLENTSFTVWGWEVGGGQGAALIQLCLDNCNSLLTGFLLQVYPFNSHQPKAQLTFSTSFTLTYFSGGLSGNWE